MSGRTLERDEARRFYDKMGLRQDTQAFYEDPATRLLLQHGDFERAQRVFELGCGTGRFAALLLADYLPAEATYLGVDLSPRMIGLARERLEGYGPRAEVRLTDGEIVIPESSASFDRFVSNYVLDLLSEDDIRSVLGEAHRLLVPDGLLCLAGLSTGSGLLSKGVAWMISRVHSLSPRLVGGCRPLELCRFLADERWQLRMRQPVAPFGIPSEAIVAVRR